jgi:hypothetical protein
MYLLRRTSLVAAFLLVSTPSARAQAPVDPSGHWEGTVQIPGRPELPFEVDLARSGTGELTGAITVADTKGIPLAKAAVDGRAMSFAARSDQPFNAAISEDGKRMSGTATLSGYSLPFAMSRTGDARLAPPVVSETVSKELEGVWNGALQVQGAVMRLVLTVANQPGGKAVGRIVSVDEGGLTVPIVITQKGTSVSYEQRGVAGSYAGTLNAEGTELAGTFSQGPAALPLTFRRAAK